MRRVKTEIIVAGAICDEISDDVKRFHVANIARDYFVYSFGFFFCIFPHSCGFERKTLVKSI